jgi:hypothetical protein
MMPSAPAAWLGPAAMSRGARRIRAERASGGAQRTAAGLEAVEQRRIATALAYDSGQQACDAAFIGGPGALAWSRFDAAMRSRVHARYVQAIEPWRYGGSNYRVPGEFVIVSAVATPSVGEAEVGVSANRAGLRGAG